MLSSKYFPSEVLFLIDWYDKAYWQFYYVINQSKHKELIYHLKLHLGQHMKPWAINSCAKLVNLDKYPRNITFFTVAIVTHVAFSNLRHISGLRKIQYYSYKAPCLELWFVAKTIFEKKHLKRILWLEQWNTFRWHSFINRHGLYFLWVTIYQHELAFKQEHILT